MTEKKWAMLVQFVKFGIVGLSNTLIHYVTYLICIYLGCHYLLASVIGFFVSVTNAFYWNNKYVFKAAEGEERSLIKAYLKTVLSYSSTSLILENILLVVWVSVLHIDQMIAPLVTLIITIPLNFLLNKYWAFGSRRCSEKVSEEEG